MSDRAHEAPETRDPSAQRMKLRYGFNEVYGWWHLAQGPAREKIQRRLRLMGTSVIRVFAFDQPVPHPVKEWDQFASYLQGVLDAGAKPMVTFAKFHPPYDDPKNITKFFCAMRRDRLELH